MTDDVREIEPSGPNGLGAAADRPGRASTACPPPPALEGDRVGDRRGADHRRGADRDEPAADRRDRPAVAVAVRVPGRPAGPAHLLLRRAGRPGRHPVILNITSTDVLHTLVGAGARRPGPGRARRRRPDLVQGRRGGPLRGPLDGVLRHRLPGDARLGAGGQRARVRGLRRAARRADLREAQGIVQRGRRQQADPEPDGGRRVTRRPSDPRPEVVTRGVPAPRQAWIERATSADHKTVGAALHRHRARLPRARGGRVRAHAGAADRAREPHDPARDLQPAADRRRR